MLAVNILVANIFVLAGLPISSTGPASRQPQPPSPPRWCKRVGMHRGIVCVAMHIDRSIDMCMRVDICIDTWMDMCIDMCMETCA